MNKNTKSTKLYGIQYLRGIAAVLVVLAHTTGMARMQKYFNYNILSGFFDLGDVGVELFFVISGFIITYVTLEDSSIKPKIDVKTFFIRRFTRIIPFMWVCIIVFAITRLFVRDYFPWPAYLRALTLYPLQNVEPKQIWTLRHEFLFYTIFSFCVLRLRTKKAILILWFLSPVFWKEIKLFLLTSNESLIELGDFVFSRYNILFGIGWVLGFLFKKNSFKFKIILPNSYLINIIAIIPLLLILQFMRKETDLSMLSQEVIIGIISAGIVVLSVSLVSEKYSRVGNILGDASYSIYLIHGIPIAAILGWWSNIQPSANPILVLIVITFISCAIGIAVHYWIEKPLVNYVQRKMYKYEYKITHV